ncbi:HAD-IC family P-type ATPase [Myxococcota bacterium]|nr:HAD-IC family P-type ATPase [Myxococcota bacterium]
MSKKNKPVEQGGREALHESEGIKGLSRQEVAQRVLEGRTNAVKRETSRTYQGIALSNLFNVFNLVVFSIAAVLVALFFVFGDKRTLYDSLAIGTVAIVNSVISMIQEIRAKIALDKIVALSRSMSSVVREGSAQDIAMDDIVAGDVVWVKRGDQVPVDGEVLASRHCEVDESLLTGESEYIFKEGGDAVRSGSFCVAGMALIRAEKVGVESYIHKLAREVRSYKRFVSPLQRSIDRLVQVMIGLAVILGVLVVGRALADFLLKSAAVLPASLPMTAATSASTAAAVQEIAIETTRSVASIVTSMVPIGLILLTTVAFALGVFRISQQGALIQKLNAVESFAHIDTLCMDKTGTLTKNELQLAEVTPLDDALDEATMRVLLGAFAHGATDQNATLVAIAKSQEAPVMEISEEVPFNSKEKYSGLCVEIRDASDAQDQRASAEGKKESSEEPKEQVWKGRPLRLVMGAYERLRQGFTEEAKQRGDALLASKHGLRNLAFACVDGEAGDFREIVKARHDGALRLLGIFSLVDEVRPDIGEVLGRFAERGIRLKIISGDAAETVQAVARASGWQESTERVVTGPELDQMTPAQIGEVAKEHSLFARVSPQNKKALISSLQAQKRYVAMVGDGVNDVLALKQAQLGVAMGDGNRMSKDVSDIVLLNNDFAIMPQVLAEGETIIGNVQSSAKLFLTKNVYAAILILATGFLGMAFPFVPRHVTIIGFFSISVPALLITFSKRMSDLPAHFLRDVLRFTATSGAMIAGSALVSYFLSLVVFRQPVEVARVALLTQVVLLSLLNFLIIIGRERMWELVRKNWELSSFALGFAVLYFVLLFVVTKVSWLSGLASFLELHPLSLRDIGVALGLSVGVGMAMILTHQRILRDERVREEEERQEAVEAAKWTA